MAKTKLIVIISVVILVIIAGAFYFITNPIQESGTGGSENLPTADSLRQGGSPSEEPVEEEEESLPPTTEPQDLGITSQELALHNTAEDCWVVYGGKVYDFTNTKMHPNMAKTFYSHCGELTGFEEGATSRHSGSSSDRVENFGTYLGNLS